jgi:hypothetical protein
MKRCFLIILLTLAPAAHAQVRSSTITGTVADQTGAVIPNASVTVTNEQTNVSQEVKTTATGEYTAPYLGAGRYQVSVSAQGFQVYRKTGITIGTATAARADVTLTPGAVATSVEVQADATVLQTENSTVQGAVNQNIIAILPNVNNNPIYYATLQAGVVPSPQMYNGARLGVGYADRRDMSAVRINGAPLGTNDIQLDGISVQGAAWRETAVLPDRDSLQEVRVTSNSFGADIGSGQGSISMITKSGTNQFHGTLRYRLRNELLNANGMSNNLRGISRTKYRLNEAGGTVGGPVIVPRLLNGKDKLFFFVSFNRLTHADPVNFQARVPTELERRGDFSKTMVADNNGRPVPVQIFNPFTAAPYQGSPTVFIRQPYPNAVIPTPDPFGLKYLQAYPKPNQPPTDAFDNNNYFFSGTSPVVRNSLNSRIDYHPGPRNSIYLSGGFTKGTINVPNRWGSNVFVSMAGAPTEDQNPYVSVGDTITLNPTTVADFRYGVTRISTATSIPVTTGFDYNAWGMPAAIQQLSPLFGTAPSVANFGGPIAALNQDGWNRKKENQTNHAISGSVTKILNKWTLKSGSEYRVYLGNWMDLRYGTPALVASNHNGQLGGLTGGNSSLITDPALRGISFASALTGVAGYDMQAGTSTKVALAAKYFAIYSQNDWKATSRLTINLGLRYEVQPGPTERYNRVSSLDVTKPNPYATGLTSPHPLAKMGLIAFPGVEGYSRNLWDTDYKNISPRVGAAFRLTSSTVLRGGYGRAYTPSNTGFNANGLIYGTGPFSAGAQPNPYGVTPNGVPAGRFYDLQNTLIIPAKGAVQAPGIYGGANASVSVDLLMRNYRNGVTDQWNFFIERSFGRAWLVSVGYVGSRGFNLPWRGYQLGGNWDIADSTLQTWRTGWIASNGLNDPAAAQIPNPLPALVGQAVGTISNSTISVANSMRAYLGLFGQMVTESKARSNYNALQVRVEHAYSNGFQMALNYSWSKATGLYGGRYSSTYAESQNAGAGSAGGGGIDYRNLENNRGLLSYDTPQRFVGVASYLLPTGKGKKLDPGNSFLRALIGDWQFGGVLTLQSGQPWGPNCGGMNGRCNIVPGAPVEVPEELQRWYDGKTSVTLPSGRIITPGQYTFLKWNPDRYTVPIVQFPNGRYQVDQYWWGSTAAHLGELRSPSFSHMNLTVSRQIRIAEKVQLEFLAEASNFLNQTNFNPSGVSTGYGAILVEDPRTNAKVGQNSSTSFGTMSTNLFEPRNITLSLRLRF